MERSIALTTLVHKVKSEFYLTQHHLSGEQRCFSFGGTDYLFAREQFSYRFSGQSYR